MEIFESNQGKRTSSSDLMNPEHLKKKTQKEAKKIKSGKNDIIERSEQKTIIEDGRELL